MYKGSPSCPEERRLIPSVEAMSQMSFLEPQIGDSANIMWFFVIEVDEELYADTISLVGFLDGVQVVDYPIQIEGFIPVMASVDKKLKEPIKLDKPAISIKTDKTEKARSDE